MTQKFKVGDRVARNTRCYKAHHWGNLEAPAGSLGHVAEVVGSFVTVVWDSGVRNAQGDIPTIWYHPSELVGHDDHVGALEYHAADCPCAPSKPVTCRAPWWAVWNPCSRFGWIVYMVLGAMVPTILQNI